MMDLIDVSVEVEPLLSPARHLSASKYNPCIIKLFSMVGKARLTNSTQPVLLLLRFFSRFFSIFNFFLSLFYQHILHI